MIGPIYVRTRRGQIIPLYRELIECVGFFALLSALAMVIMKL